MAALLTNQAGARERLATGDVAASGDVVARGLSTQPKPLELDLKPPEKSSENMPELRSTKSSPALAKYTACFNSKESLQHTAKPPMPKCTHSVDSKKVYSGLSDPGKNDRSQIDRHISLPNKVNEEVLDESVEPMKIHAIRLEN